MNNWLNRAKKDLQRNWVLYLMVVPVVVYLILFHYKPLYGALIAFQDYKPAKGFGANWVGLKHFKAFFTNPYFPRLIKNTLGISFLNLLIGFPIPIIIALLFNEIKSKAFNTVAQSLLNLPHFISLVAICGMLRQFCMSDGLFNQIIMFFGGEASPLLQRPELYKAIYVLSDLWQGMGWNSIIFVAAISGIDKQLYEAAIVDGAGKWKQMIHVTIPGIMPTIIVMLILKVGGLMSIGQEKTLLLYNEAIYETSDIISSYVYRMGLLDQQWSYATAVGLFTSAINIILVFATNKISKKVSDTALW